MAAKYNGPAYNRGIVIDGKTYDPKKMDDKAKATFLKKYPARSHWWSEGKTKKGTADK